MNQPAYNIVTRYPQTPGPVIRVFLLTFWHDRVLGSDTLLASDRPDCALVNLFNKGGAHTAASMIVYAASRSAIAVLIFATRTDFAIPKSLRILI